MLVTKNVLIDIFWKVRNKFNSVCNVLLPTIMNGLIFGIFYNLPTIFIKNIPTNFITIFMPYIVSGLVFGGYYFKRNRDFKIAFNKLNDEIGDIAKLSDNDENKSIIMDLEKSINDFIQIKIELETEKQILEKITSISNSQSVTNDYTKELDNARTIEESTIETKVNLSNEQLDSYSSLDSSVMEEFEEPSTDVKGPRLIKK